MNKSTQKYHNTHFLNCFNMIQKQLNIILNKNIQKNIVIIVQINVKNRFKYLPRHTSSNRIAYLSIIEKYQIYGNVSMSGRNYLESHSRLYTYANRRYATVSVGVLYSVSVRQCRMIGRLTIRRTLNGTPFLKVSVS